jgi:hypothetical protein
MALGATHDAMLTPYTSTALALSKIWLLYPSIVLWACQQGLPQALARTVQAQKQRACFSVLQKLEEGAIHFLSSMHYRLVNDIRIQTWTHLNCTAFSSSNMVHSLCVFKPVNSDKLHKRLSCRNLLRRIKINTINNKASDKMILQQY